MGFIRDWRRRAWLRRYPISNQSWGSTIARTPLLQMLPAADRVRLRQLATVFIQEKTWVSAAELTLTEEMQLRIAALAALPILGLDLDWYLGWDTVIVYPGEFVHPRKEVDEGGLVHQWNEVRSGESWEHGPVIFSWADVVASGRVDGYNVVIHEFAHKLDMLNGPPDGFPPLHGGMSVRRWTGDFTTAFEALNACLDEGREPPVDEYAAQDPAEFFAVLSEYFFELPHYLREVWPAIYADLCAFYRQDPLSWPGFKA
ncbi:MAG: zinc-dependent peptidase [Chromatiales bacterium]|jgi:Mlc titration factor MtfA (ptsG expression regulator)|nr:zinc-dependent peptidase [Chromatiales bacterium]